jgi:NhaA family Na+:H+ antiporter
MDDLKTTLESFPTPPEASVTVRRMAKRITAPVEQFLHTERAGGLLLLAAAAAALIWANSPWSGSYASLWHTPIGIGIGDWSFVQSLHFWINDLLMTFFFLVAGLEIKREMVQGELSDLKRASLPIAAAVGGMVIPAAIYFALNTGPETRNGWGVPMATDIAFALGILSLLGSRVPAALRILLLAVAIIDDLGAILVIALFYSSGFSIIGLIVAIGAFGLLILFQRLGVRPGAGYLIPLLIMWGGFLGMGVHPTIAGVVVGLSMPMTPWINNKQFAEIAQKSINDYLASADNPRDDHEVLRPLRTLSVAGRETVSPVVRLQHAIHPWVSFFIMPLFAFANAGVNLGGVDIGLTGATSAMLGITLGLAIGKPLGIVGTVWIFTKLGVCSLPRGVNAGGVLVLGLVAGIGFTMSIFIAELAFAGSPLLGAAKLAILGATAVAAIGGLILGSLLLPKELSAEIRDLGPADVEQSTIY